MHSNLIFQLAIAIFLIIINQQLQYSNNHKAIPFHNTCNLSVNDKTKRKGTIVYIESQRQKKSSYVQKNQQMWNNICQIFFDEFFFIIKSNLPMDTSQISTCHNSCDMQQQFAMSNFVPQTEIEKQMAALIKGLREKGDLPSFFLVYSRMMQDPSEQDSRFKQLPSSLSNPLQREREHPEEVAYPQEDRQFVQKKEAEHHIIVIAARDPEGKIKQDGAPKADLGDQGLAKEVPSERNLFSRKEQFERASQQPLEEEKQSKQLLKKRRESFNELIKKDEQKNVELFQAVDKFGEELSKESSNEEKKRWNAQFEAFRKQAQNQLELIKNIKNRTQQQCMREIQAVKKEARDRINDLEYQTRKLWENEFQTLKKVAREQTEAGRLRMAQKRAIQQGIAKKARDQRIKRDALLQECKKKEKKREEEVKKEKLQIEKINAEKRSQEKYRRSWQVRK